MNKARAQALQKKAEEIGKGYSDPNRPKNYGKEAFILTRVVPLSDDSAAVYYVKDGGKTALAWFYWVNVRGGEWWHIFPTDSHLVGMEAIIPMKLAVEEGNWEHNFEVSDGMNAPGSNGVDDDHLEPSYPKQEPGRSARTYERGVAAPLPDQLPDPPGWL